MNFFKLHSDVSSAVGLHKFSVVHRNRPPLLLSTVTPKNSRQDMNSLLRALPPTGVAWEGVVQVISLSFSLEPSTRCSFFCQLLSKSLTTLTVSQSYSLQVETGGFYCQRSSPIHLPPLSNPLLFIPIGQIKIFKRNLIHSCKNSQSHSICQTHCITHWSALVSGTHIDPSITNKSQKGNYLVWGEGLVLISFSRIVIC